jgi:hypothetical protein
VRHQQTRRATALSRVPIETPRHCVSSLDQRVTQWISAVTVSAGSAWISSQLQDLSSLPSCRIENVH